MVVDWLLLLVFLAGAVFVLANARRLAAQPRRDTTWKPSYRAYLVVAAAVVKDRRLLLVSKRQAPDIFYLPGGKRDAGEDDLACLHRELDEELGITAVDPMPWREVVAPAALEPGQHLRMRVFLARLGGSPSPAGEIARLHWWRPDDCLRLAPAIEQHVIPALTADGMIG